MNEKIIKELEEKVRYLGLRINSGVCLPMYKKSMIKQIHEILNLLKEIK
jgi:hypothetical protein